MSPETWVNPRSRTCRSGNSLKRELRVPVTSSRQNRSIFTTLQPSLGWETPRRGRRSHGSRLCWQISIASFVVSQKFSVSILASSQKWDTATPPTTMAKTIERLATLQTSLHTTPYTLCNPSARKTSFNGSSWPHGSTACIALPRTFTASLKQRYNSDWKVVEFRNLLGGHTIVCDKISLL